MEWKPIDTAPKDGLQFLAYGDEAGFGVVNYDKNILTFVESDVLLLVDGGYYTHWMPLPAPPAE